MCNRQEKSKNPKFLYPRTEKKYRKFRAILYNWKTADRIEAGFSLNKRVKRAENKSDWHHARSNHRFRDIWLQFTPVKLMWKTFFLVFFPSFSRTRMKLFRFLFIYKKMYSKILFSLREIKGFVFRIFRPFLIFI